MIDWDKHEKAVCVSVAYFDNRGDCIHTCWRDRPVTQTKTVADSNCSKDEKWTHEYGGVPCRIEIEKQDEHGYIVIYVQGDGYLFCEPDDIKPIKHRITKAEAWDKLQYMAGIEGYTYSNAVEEIYDRYEVIDD